MCVLVDQVSFVHGVELFEEEIKLFLDFSRNRVARLLRQAQLTNDPELFLLVAIAICLATAALAQAAGFSVVLGAFVAGVSISGSEDLHHTHTQLVPLRDAFVALFFVSLGTLIDPKALWHSLPLFGIMVALIVVGKFVIWSIVVWLFRYPLPTAIAVAAGLTQIGELSSGLVAENVFSATIAASLTSILLNVFVVRGVFRWLDSKAR
jgi:CPA2 family monovalent cation:H+ antiporter-2